MLFILAVKTKNDQTEVVFGRLRADVSKVQTECDDRSSFGLADAGDGAVGGTGHFLFVDRHGIQAR